jgi:carbon-monoxide dehydrogenase medium subunit/2-furoyl-CoA dehydrogenase FAD binding subunit
LAAQLIGQALTPALAKDVAQAAAAQSEPGNDMHASAPYRRHLSAVLLERVLRQSATQATA